jgi:hypothetical protein
MELTNKIITKQQTENRKKVKKVKKVNIEDIELFTNLITEYKYKFVENIKLSNTIIQEYDTLLWKDFLLYFKKAFSQDLDEIYTGKLSTILRQLLHIDQDLHIRKGIKLTFREWLELYTEEEF